MRHSCYWGEPRNQQVPHSRWPADANRLRGPDNRRVSSFDLMALGAALEAEPGLTTGWLTPRWFHPPTALEALRNLGHRAWHMERDAVTEELVVQAHGAGIKVALWTVDAPDAIRQVARAGVDVVITNVPDLARAALAAE